MLIGKRLREIRKSKNLSQGDIERKTGLLRSYTSRVEHGHTVPTIENLEKYAAAFEVPIYRMFYEGNKPPRLKSPSFKSGESLWGGDGKSRDELRLFARALSQLNDKDRDLLFAFATQFARRAERSAKRTKDRNPTVSLSQSKRGSVK
jgi:transcriptional regulator with XRE-family HTH domain